LDATNILTTQKELTRSVAVLLVGLDAGDRDRSDGGPKRVFRSSVGQEYPVGGT
jgi:hypothetical protein|tara:strand:+ start:474 stop:635 length:162 start_codon:yes stop_codon:yes gene_type:complete